MTRLFIGFLSLVAALMAGTAHAYTLIYAGDRVTAIANLEIDGSYYNVDFEGDAYSTFGGETIFWETESEVNTSIIAIDSVLSEAGPSRFEAPLLNHGGGSDGAANFDEVYVVRWDNFGSPFASQSSISNQGNWQYLGAADESLFGPERILITSTAWTVAVPVPAAIWLFGSALAGLGWFRRKKALIEQ